jgi:hypothetical protein
MTGLGLDFGFGEQAHGVPRAEKLKLVVDKKDPESAVEEAKTALSPSDLEDKQLSMLNDLRSQYVKARWWERKKIQKAIADLTKELGMQDMVLDVEPKSTAKKAKKLAGEAKISLLQQIAPEKAAKQRKVDEARARELLEKIKETMGGDVSQPITPTILYSEPKAPIPKPETTVAKKQKPETTMEVTSTPTWTPEEEKELAELEAILISMK